MNHTTNDGFSIIYICVMTKYSSSHMSMGVDRQFVGMFECILLSYVRSNQSCVSQRYVPTFIAERWELRFVPGCSIFL
jgi:hypothetical protein